MASGSWPEMHPNPTFRGTTRDESLAFARQRGFGTLARLLLSLRNKPKCLLRRLIGALADMLQMHHSCAEPQVFGTGDSRGNPCVNAAVPTIYA